MPSEILVDGQVLLSEKVTTQGDPLVMILYALTTIPLINSLSCIPQIKEAWYAEVASASGSFLALQSWWDKLRYSAPILGYHTNLSDALLMTKVDNLFRSKELFHDSGVDITKQGQPFLYAILGPEEYNENFVIMKVPEWKEEPL